VILNLSEFFQRFKDETYCIIKPDKKLPEYKKGSDIDIFCYDMNKLSKIIIGIGNKYVERDLEILITKMNGQMYVDFVFKSSHEIEFRFDLYEKLPMYKNILLKPALFENVLENRVSFELKNSINIFIPNSIDDNILRYIEYQEWYGKRPDKIKHINYILEHFENKKMINKFLEKLHHYTELPTVEAVYPVKNKIKVGIKRNKINYIKRVIRKLLPNKVISIIKKIL